MHVLKCNHFIHSPIEQLTTTIGLKVAVIEMHGRRVRVLGVHDTAQPTREERDALSRLVSLGPVDATLGGGLQSLLRHAAVHHAEVDAGLLEDVAAGHDARHAPAAVVADPGILLEAGLAVDVLDGLGDLELGLAAHLLELGAHGVVAVGAGLALPNQRFGDGVLRETNEIPCKRVGVQM